jgi:Tfp pilus assembly protein PilO
MRSDPPHWTLDRRVPISLILAILLQTVIVAGWAFTTTARVDMLEAADAERKRQIESVLLANANTASALAELKGDVRVLASEARALGETLRRLETFLRQPNDGDRR